MHGGFILMFVASLGFAACTTTSAPDPTDRAEQALEQANLSVVDVDWDEDARVAHLTGTVESTADRERAGEVATAAVGTTGKVLNEVTIKGINESAADNLDGRIRSDLKRMIGEDQVLRDRNIEFNVNNGVVTVKGDVRTVAEKNHVTDIVKTAPGVKDMANSLVIKPKE
jgi:osmotically-inducible protein OsmY